MNLISVPTPNREESEESEVGSDDEVDEVQNPGAGVCFNFANWLGAGNSMRRVNQSS